MNQETVQLSYLKIAPRKVRLIADTLRGLSYSEAEAQLMLRPQRASDPLLKLLRSAGANIRNNKKSFPEKYIISKILVNKGPMLKRSLPRAKGMATPLHKVMSHVVLVLSESEKENPSRFLIVKKEKPKKEEKENKKKATNKKVEIHSESDKHVDAYKEKGEHIPKGGLMKRMFRRKSV
ncbi:MAG: 50S ribosomal protein L22 [Candidatus Pacebacteria bacterium]|nr:50S ribosomal protein L22 [Candidatus Paceibacterota bacterium]